MFERLPDATATKLKDMLKTVGQSWASGLDGRGKPGSEVLKEFNALLEQAPASR